MKWILMAGFAAAMLAAAPALAQDDHHRHGGHPQAVQHRENPQPHPQAIRIEHRAPMNDVRNRNIIIRNERVRENRNLRIHVNEHRENNRTRNIIINHSMNTRTIVIEPRHNRPNNWNVRPRNFDVRIYRRSFVAPQRFHWRVYYHRPHGWYYRRWSYGQVLPHFFWVRDYWITDWWMFDLQRPPYGYEWVRYGDDALLVNIYTGEVLEAIYDLFD